LPRAKAEDLVYIRLVRAGGLVNQETDDWGLVRAVLAGERGADARFIRRAADALWSSCRRLTRNEAEARAAFNTTVTALRAGDFAALKAYDRRSRLDTFLALFTRDALGREILRHIAADADKGWQAFETQFSEDLKQLVRRRLAHARWAGAREDAYQEICAGLASDGCRRLIAYEGRGSPAGFVLHVADRLLLDFLRGLHARRRLPAAVARLPLADQELFRLIWWQGMTPENARMALAGRALSERELPLALARLHRAVPADYQPGTRELTLADAPEPLTDATPEALMLAGQQDRALADATRALQTLAAGLPESERLYLNILLTGAEDLPAREMARLMQMPVEEVYRLRQRVLKRLKEGLEGNDAVKKWLVSV
jgi:RNA polymerase primary sigma factor